MDILEARLGRDLEEALSASIKPKRETASSLLNSTTGSLSLLLCPLRLGSSFKNQTMLEGSIIQQLAIAPQQKRP